MERKPKRRTQEDRRQAARAALIESAIVMLSEKGYGSATTAAIALHAKMTTGALHYHFPSKDDLFIAVLDQLTIEALVVLTQLDGTQNTGQSVGRRLVASLWSLYGSARYWAVWEINMGFRPSPDKRAMLVKHRLATREKMCQAVASNDTWSMVERDVVLSFLPFLLSCVRGTFLDTYFTGHNDAYLEQQLATLSDLIDEKLQSAQSGNESEPYSVPHETP